MSKFIKGNNKTQPHYFLTINDCSGMEVNEITVNNLGDLFLFGVTVQCWFGLLVVSHQVEFDSN